MRPARFDAVLVLVAAALACGDDRSGLPLGAGAGGVVGTSGAAGGGGSSGASGTAGGAAGAGGLATDPLAAISWDDSALVDLGDVLGQRMLARLGNLCAGCHDDLWPERDSVAGVDVLVRLGWVVPGSSEASRLVEILAEGHPSVSGAAVPPATPGDAELMARFVDGLVVAPPACTTLPFVSIDEVFRAIAADVAELPAGTRPFARYLGVAYASNAGLCADALDRQRLALFEAANAASLGEAIVVPLGIDEGSLIYRIDLRDYRWDRSIDLFDDGQSPLTDAWLGITEAAAPYAVEYQGPDADIVKGETQTPVPFLPANAFVHAVAGGELYYALVGARRDTEVHRAELGLATEPTYLAPASGLARAAIADDTSGNDVLVLRGAQERPGRAYWVHSPQEYGGESLFDDPLGSDYIGSQILFGLPNGMLGFIIESPIWTRDTAGVEHFGCRGCAARSAGIASCSACHAAGHLALRDDLRSYVETHSVDFDTQTFEEVLASYPAAAELAELVRADDIAPFAALEQLGIPFGVRDPLSRVHQQFEHEPLTLRRAAAELGVPYAALESALPTLESLSALRGGGTLERAAFSAAYLAAACRLHASSLQRPAACP